AEVVLVFGAKSSTYLSGLNYSGVGSTATANYSTVVVGDGIVVKPIDSDRVRLLMKFTDKRTYIFERKPSTNFARAFIKAYEKANEDKTDD
ncbi:MAG: hypothetical protein SVK08_07675, partial [Halobacteriota archaeon]|nr:hypothetical protein [Halobacteriota archaeon]